MGTSGRNGSPSINEHQYYSERETGGVVKVSLYAGAEVGEVVGGGHREGRRIALGLRLGPVRWASAGQHVFEVSTQTLHVKRASMSRGAVARCDGGVQSVLSG